MKKIKTIDWNKMSELGLIQRINSEVLHPLGLAISINPENATSESILVADDGVWEYSEEIKKLPVLTDYEIKEQINQNQKRRQIMSLSDAIKHGNKDGCNELTKSELLQITQAACGCVNGTLVEWPLLNRSFKKLGILLPLNTPYQELRNKANEVLTYLKT